MLNKKTDRWLRDMHNSDLLKDLGIERVYFKEKGPHDEFYDLLFKGILLNTMGISIADMMQWKEKHGQLKQKAKKT